MNYSEYREAQEARLRRNKIVNWTWKIAWAISDGLKEHGLQLEAALTILDDVINKILENQDWLTLPEIEIADAWIKENLREIFKKEWL